MLPIVETRITVTISSTESYVITVPLLGTGKITFMQLPRPFYQGLVTHQAFAATNEAFAATNEAKVSQFDNDEIIISPNQ